MKTILRHLPTNFKFTVFPGLLFVFLSFQHVHGQVSDFMIRIDDPCAPSVVVFINTSTTGQNIEYLWDFGKEALISSREEVLSEAYTEPGTYEIVLSVIEGTDTVRSSRTLQIAEGPGADFSVDVSEGCVPLEVHFSNTSSEGDAPVQETFWDFRNGDTGTGNEYGYTYSQPGTFGIFMEVTDANGCSDFTEASGLIRVHPAPVADFTTSDSFACDPPLVVNFTNQSDGEGVITSLWNFGNGNTSGEFNGTAVYYGSGTYDVSLQVSDANGCTDSLVREGLITIGSDNGDIYAVSGNTLFYDDNSLLCPGTIVFAATVPSQTDHSWYIEYNGLTELYENADSVVYHAPDSGRIEVKLVFGLTTECPDSLIKSFRIDHIDAGFSMDPDYTCELPADIRLTNTSENAVSYQWFLPGGESSEETDPTYSFPRLITHRYLYNHNENEYTVPITLVAENGNGCTDTMTVDFEANLPVARFMPDIASGCIPLEVTFSDSSVSNDPVIEWTYVIDGRNYSSSDNDPFLYTFDTPGKYPVRLIIETDRNCLDTSYAVMIAAGDEIDPFFSVSPENICYGDTLYLNDESSFPDSIDSWQYSSSGLFNTGAIAVPDTLISIGALTAGPKDVELTTDFNGCLNDTTITGAFTVMAPAGSIDYSFDCSLPLVYTFFSDVQNADGLTWYIDDTTFTDSDTVVYEFEHSGKYEIALEANNSGSGCSWQKKIYVNVRDIQADFFVKQFVCRYDSVEFNSSGSVDYINECYIEGFLWDFGDNTPQRRNWDTIQGHVYQDTGTYYPSLIAFADNGCPDTLEGELEVVEPPVDFTVSPASGCGPELIAGFEFDDSIASAIDEWTWFFGDREFDDTQNKNPVHTYQAGTAITDLVFYPRLMVTDIYGCSNTASKEVTLYTTYINFYAEKTGLCLGEEAHFVIPSPGITDFTLHFGDGDSSSAELSHLYPDTGAYTVRLESERNGCELSIKRTDYIIVEEADAAFMVSDPAPDCYPATVSFDHINTSSNIADGLWTFEEGAQSQGYSPETEYTYTLPGVYTASLLIRTTNNCIASFSETIEVTGPEVEFEFEPAFICYGDSVRFGITEPYSIDEFQWIFGDGGSSDELNPVHAYYADGELYPALRVREGDCEVTLTDEPLYVSNIRADFELDPEKESYCYLDSLTAINRSADYNQSIWRINGFPVSTSQHLSGLIFDRRGEMYIALEVSNTIGCTDTILKTFEVADLPQFSITGNTYLCAGNSGSPLSITGFPSWSVQWSPARYFDSPNSYITIIRPDSSTYITATATNGNGCSVSQSLMVTVLEAPDLSWSPNDTTIIIGDTVQLHIRSDIENSAYVWSPDYQISCTTCNDPYARPFESTVYRVDVTDECGTSTVEIFVEVIADHYLELPNAFTPNGDSQNDVFMFESGNIREAEFSIFNRWGNLVYSSNSLTEGWNGYFQGKLQNTDTYTYYIRAVTVHGFEFEKKGTFLLLR